MKRVFGGKEGKFDKHIIIFIDVQSKMYTMPLNLTDLSYIQSFIPQFDLPTNKLCNLFSNGFF